MRCAKITSPANPLVKEIMRIKKRTERPNTFLIEGPHLVDTAIRSPEAHVERILFTEAFALQEEGRRLIQQAKAAADLSQPLVEISESVLLKLADTEAPQGIIAVVSHNAVELDAIQYKAKPLLVLCDGIQDPGNLGTIIRVSDAAGADAVVILPGTCDPLNPKSIRATAGSLFNIPVAYAGHDALAGYLDGRGIRLCLADIRAERSVYEHDFRQPTAIALGNEAHGVSNALRKKAADLIRIPIIGKAESLNVATAASICIYEAVRQRRFV